MFSVVGLAVEFDGSVGGETGFSTCRCSACSVILQGMKSALESSEFVLLEHERWLSYTVG